jgi:hypothetical protein
VYNHSYLDVGYERLQVLLEVLSQWLGARGQANAHSLCRCCSKLHGSWLLKISPTSELVDRQRMLTLTRSSCQNFNISNANM